MGDGRGRGGAGGCVCTVDSGQWTVEGRTRKAHDPMKVDHSEAVSQALEEPLAKPSAPQRVKPTAPIRFQRPMCQPSVLGEGVCQSGWVSSMKSHEEVMKPVPPMTWGGSVC